MHNRPRLLVSVRDVAEALAGLAGGADLIDVKEPTCGPLGRADESTIAEVARAVAGRVPVSAALGELMAGATVPPVALDYVKWGLAGWAKRDWRAALHATPANAVAVAYADWAAAESPDPAKVAAFAAERRMAAFLIDTFAKNGRTLLDALSLDDIAGMVALCRQAGVPVALAGSLGVTEIDRLRDVRPDWFAVRGAACDGGREGSIDARRVAVLARLVRDAS
ncbi:MAG: (5-formylfuran-3-yl)methyl phosphate synthase [Gemmataceae bacterium]